MQLTYLIFNLRNFTFFSYEHVGEVVVSVEKHKTCQCGCKIKEHVNTFYPFLSAS